MIEIIFGVVPAFVQLLLAAFNDVVFVIVIDIDRGGTDFDTVGREIAVGDALFERICVDRFPKILVGIDIGFAFGGGGHAELAGGGEIFEDVPPVAVLIGTAAVTLVDDDEVEEIGGILFIERIFPAHESLKNRKIETVAFRNDPAVFSDFLRRQSSHCALVECSEVDQCLIGENVPVGEEEDARQTELSGIGGGAQIPLGLHEFPADLESDEGFAGSGGESEQNPVASGGNGIKNAVDGDFLIVARRLGADPERLQIETIPPEIGIGVSPLPQFFGGREMIDGMFFSRGHIHEVNFVAVSGVGEADVHQLRVFLGLRDAFKDGEFVLLGFDDGEFAPVVGQQVVDLLWFAALDAFHPSGGDDIGGLFGENAGVGIDILAPAGSLEFRVYLFQTGLRFVHASPLITPRQTPWLKSLFSVHRNPRKSCRSEIASAGSQQIVCSAFLRFLFEY